MSKVKNMATVTECRELSNSIKELKSELGLTFNELNRYLNWPCCTSTLQIRATYGDGVNCSKKLHDKIVEAIKNSQPKKVEIFDEKSELEALKLSAISEINHVINQEFKKIEAFLKRSENHVDT